MKKIILSILFAGILSSPQYAQLAVAKIVGKNADRYKLGFGVFSYYDIPVNDIGNRSVRIELLDIAYFPAKNIEQNGSIRYVSIKLGYKNIFTSVYFYTP